MQVGRLFGFQAFNPGASSGSKSDSKSKKWVPATIFVATDHLQSLLNDAFMRKCSEASSGLGSLDASAGVSDGLGSEIFKQCVYELHTTIFTTYVTQWWVCDRWNQCCDEIWTWITNLWMFATLRTTLSWHDYCHIMATVLLYLHVVVHHCNCLLFPHAATQTLLL